jgi:hypothetical protein
MTILAGPFLSFLGFGLAGVQAGAKNIHYQFALNAGLNHLTPVIGSWAAAIHATLGNIAAGSTFATAQSAGAGGAGMAIIKWALMKGYLGLNSGCIVALGLAKENCTLSS